MNEPRMTAPRQAVFDAIQAAGGPVGAYDLIKAIKPAPKPPTVYRALEFLESAGMIHRIESLNAYVTCRGEHRCCSQQHSALFTVCDSCGGVEEIHHDHILPSDLSVKGFTAMRIVTEIHGLCANCS